MNKFNHRLHRFTQIFLISVSLFLLVLLPACAPSPIIPSITETPIPSATPRLLTATPPIVTETPIPSPTAIPLERAQYTLYATLDYAAKTVEVQESILYPNLSGEPLTELVLAVEPNLWAGGFVLKEISVDGAPTDYSLEGQRMSVLLARVLEPNQNIAIKIDYTIVLPFAEQVDPSVARARIYGYTARQINLTNWYPFIVPRIGGEWVLHDPWFYGEHLVYDAVDYEVNLQVNDPSVVVAASANAESNVEWTQYKLKGGRAFVLSASPEFKVLETEVLGVKVYSYFYPLFDDPAQEVLNVTAKAIELYSRVYGAYSHQSLSVVQGDFNDGMEYSAFFFQSNGFYNTYDGTAQNYLTFVSAHETAHQWWFESVANDQATEPWLDEMLATYSERIYYENYHPEAVDWWWLARMFDYSPDTWVDLPVNENTSERAYWRTSYFHGAHFLEELRGRIGDEAFFAFLQDYRTQNAGKIATGDDFFRILRENTDVDFSDLTQKYFRMPH